MPAWVASWSALATIAPGARVDVNGTVLGSMATSATDVVEMQSGRRDVQARHAAAAVMTFGAAITVVASFATWLRSGAVERSSYDLLGLFHLLRISRRRSLRVLVRLWPLVPLLAIGAVVASLAVAVNPQCVAVGGELAETGEVLIGPMREAIRRRVLLNQIAPLEVVPAELGQRAEVLGAIALALDAAEIPLDTTEQSGGGDGGLR